MSKLTATIYVLLLVVLVFLTAYNYYDTSRYKAEQQKVLGYIQFSNDCFLERVNTAVNETRGLYKSDICFCLNEQESYLGNKTGLDNFLQEVKKSQKERDCLNATKEVRLIFA